MNQPVIPTPVIILNWNGIDDTRACVEHIMRQTGVDLEVIVADNGSDQTNVDGLTALKRTYPSIQLRLFDENYGFAKAHNIVFEEILNRKRVPPYILLINNDAFAEPQWAMSLIGMVEKEHWDIVSSKMINYFSKQQLDNVGHRLLNTGEIIPKGSGLPVSSYSESEENIGACAGAALYRTDMLRDIGMFDAYFHTGYEDAELGLRAVVAGYETGYAAEAIVHHKISQSIAKVKDFQYVKKTQVNIFYSWFKLMPWPIILLNLPFMILKYGIVLFLNGITGRRFFFRVMKSAIWATLTSERPIILQARKNFHDGRKLRSSLSILSKMEFFLWFDAKRFYRHFIRGEKTHFEKTMDA